MSAVSGQLLSHYRLLEQIGEGGMGVVWKALDTSLDREVAIKLLRSDLEADPQWLARLGREAKTVAALDHPNIVTIYSIEEAGGQRFIVMELVHGTTLSEMVPEGGLALDELLPLAIAMADAVGAAHQRGIVHRDLKPRNLMVHSDGRLKVLDFGLAKAPEPRLLVDMSGVTLESTEEGRIQGTLHYMSPEQLEGLSVDHRTDLFSLGVVLYKMATGLRPFSGSSASRVIASILRDTPRPVERLRPQLPRRLGRIIAHALEKEPRRRFQTATDLRDELRRLHEDLAGGLAGAGIRAVAVLPLEDLSGDPDQAYFADGMTDALINNLARIRALKVISRTSIMQYKGARKPLAETAHELGVDAVIEGSILRVGDRVRISAQLIDAHGDRPLWAESYEEDLGDVLSLQRRVARAIAASIAVELTPQERAQLTRADSVPTEVHEACLKGRHFWYQRTTDSVRRGLTYFEEAAQLGPEYAPAYAGIADSYIVDGGRYLGVSPKVAYSHARKAAQKAVALDDHLAEAHTSLAAVMTDYDWDWEGADREYRRAIELNPNYVTAHSWYAEQLSRMGRHAEAVGEARHARELDPLSLVSSMIVAWILYFARRYDDAIEQGLRTLELDANYATAHRILGWAYEERGRHDEAIASHERASAATGHEPNFAGQLGRAYAVAGRIDEARRVLDGLIELSGQSYVSSLDVAIIYTALGERESALDWLERAHQERADHLPYLNVNPRLDPLRGEPRFRKLLERMGFTAGGVSGVA